VANTTQLDADLLRSWRLTLQANKRSVHTIRNYTMAATSLIDWLQAQGHSLQVQAITRRDVEGWQVHISERMQEASVATHHNCLKQLFAWLVDEQEIEASPMARMPVPKIPEPEVPVLKDDQARALLASCVGTDFQARRDHAILTLLLDSGLRRQEVTSRTVATLDRYLRTRKAHPWAGRTDQLWLGERGPIGIRTINDIVSRAGKRAGLGRVHTHQLRHTWASNAKEAGLGHDELKALGGWSSDRMLERYGRASLKRRAVASGRRASVVDRLARR
jgi:site-specific recombinase XerD